jgi:hypothetical protein
MKKTKLKSFELMGVQVPGSAHRHLHCVVVVVVVIVMVLW